MEKNFNLEIISPEEIIFFPKLSSSSVTFVLIIVSSIPFDLAYFIISGSWGFNNGSPVNAQTYIKVVNKSGASAQITVTLTYVQLEVWYGW